MLNHSTFAKLLIAMCLNKFGQVPDKWKIYLVCLLEQRENLHIILTDALMEVGTTAIDSIFSKVNVRSMYIINIMHLQLSTL